MSKNLFKILKDNRRYQSELCLALQEFMLQGGFSDSEVDQFICKNYTLDVSRLTDKWNYTHSNKKKEVTFRGQVSVLSNKIYRMFETNASELESLIMNEDDTHEVSLRIINFVKAKGVLSKSLEGRFSFTIQDYLRGHEPVGVYSVSECIEEIRLLKMMDKKNLEAIFSQVDTDKLAYVMEMMRADLILYESMEYEQKDKSTKEVLKKADGSVATRKVFNPVINDIKMALLLEFNSVKVKRLSVANQEIESKEKGVLDSKPIYEPKEVIDSNSKMIPKLSSKSYQLNISYEQRILIEKKRREKPSVREINEFSFDLVAEYKNYILSLKVDSNIEELEEWLSNVNRNAFETAIDELERGVFI